MIANYIDLDHCTYILTYLHTYRTGCRSFSSTETDNRNYCKIYSSCSSMYMSGGTFDAVGSKANVCYYLCSLCKEYLFFSSPLSALENMRIVNKKTGGSVQIHKKRKAMYNNIYPERTASSTLSKGASGKRQRTKRCFKVTTTCYVTSEYNSEPMRSRKQEHII